MKKTVLVQKIFEKSKPKFSKKKVYNMVNFLIEEMSKGINSEEGLKIYGFGNFKKKGKRISFRPSKKILNKLNSKNKISKI